MDDPKIISGAKRLTSEDLSTKNANEKDTKSLNPVLIKPKRDDGAKEIMKIDDRDLKRVADRLYNTVILGEPDKNFVNSKILRSNFIHRPAEYEINTDKPLLYDDNMIKLSGLDKIKNKPISAILGHDKKKLWDIYSEKRFKKDPLSNLNSIGILITSPLK